MCVCDGVEGHRFLYTSIITPFFTSNYWRSFFPTISPLPVSFSYYNDRHPLTHPSSLRLNTHITLTYYSREYFSSASLPLFSHAFSTSWRVELREIFTVRCSLTVFHSHFPLDCLLLCISILWSSSVMSRFSSITVFLFFHTICLIFVFIQVSRGETCENPIYQRFSPNHTACKKDNIQCHKAKAGVSEDDIQTILRVHNEYRNRIASGKEKEQYKFPSAANMMQLVWDQELADIAQSHANQCDFNHDCNNCREVDDFQVGQNLYQRKTSWLQPVANWTKAIKSFYDEISFTPTKVKWQFPLFPSFSHAKFFSHISHFTFTFF